MSNQEQSFPQSAQEADEQQNPSVSQEDLPNLDEEQLEAVTGAGWRSKLTKLIDCVSCNMTPPPSPRAPGPHPQTQQLLNTIDQQNAMGHLNWINSLHRSGSRNEGSVGSPPHTPPPGGPKIKKD